jgi:hypothetical protein
LAFVAGRSIITKKGEGSQVKESTDSSTTIEDDDVKGKAPLASDAAHSVVLYQKNTSPLATILHIILVAGDSLLTVFLCASILAY